MAGGASPGGAASSALRCSSMPQLLVDVDASGPVLDGDLLPSPSLQRLSTLVGSSAVAPSGAQIPSFADVVAFEAGIHSFSPSASLSSRSSHPRVVSPMSGTIVLLPQQASLLGLLVLV